MAVIWCSACGGIIQSGGEAAGGKNCECSTPLKKEPVIHDYLNHALCNSTIQRLEKERNNALLQNRETEEARQILWKKLVLVILATGGPVNVNKHEAELFDAAKYQLIEIDSFHGRDYVLKVAEKRNDEAGRDTCIPKPTGRALQYCSEYQKTSRDHAPTCSFYGLPKVRKDGV